jgi:hypothetical protein
VTPVKEPPRLSRPRNDSTLRALARRLTRAGHLPKETTARSPCRSPQERGLRCKQRSVCDAVAPQACALTVGGVRRSAGRTRCFRVDAQGRIRSGATERPLAVFVGGAVVAERVAPGSALLRP